MSEGELGAAVKSFEGVIRASEQVNQKGNRMAATLGTFFAMQCAFKVRTYLRTFGGEDDHGGTRGATTEGHPLDCGILPKFVAVHDAAERLIAAVGSKNRSGIMNGLTEMGVLALCPRLSQQFMRMEYVARSVTGRAQLIPFVELSLFAIELGEFEKAWKYVMEARSLDPSSYELYSLCVVEGVIAVNAGRHREAVQFLEKSINACQRDEYSSLACGVRGPNLALVEELLDNGQRVEVLRHLLQCKDVWQTFRPQIDIWISLIESGERPNFRASGMLRAMNEPGYKLLMQYARAISMEEEASSANSNAVPSLSPAEIAARRERLSAEYKRHRDASTNDQRGPSDT